jgi:protein TonB
MSIHTSNTQVGKVRVDGKDFNYRLDPNKAYDMGVYCGSLVPKIALETANGVISFSQAPTLKNGSRMLEIKVPNAPPGIQANSPAGTATGRPPGIAGVTGLSTTEGRKSTLSGPAISGSRPAVRSTNGPVRISTGVAEGLLLRGVTPQYPPMARSAHIEGTVVLRAVIAKDGSVQDLRVVSGHPMLASAALQAVRQWQYRPYKLDGQPVDVDTTINVKFTLEAGK